ncbi:MAG: M14 family zinc carboxypeptidase [Actinobacteria bacterium]|nr:M14 family zinc carboxypeptidase [Actinomycetota bacterium]
MSSGPYPQELEYLQEVYRHTCEAFDRGELSSTQARTAIMRLRHTDVDGVTWKVDTTRSGRRAAFVRVNDQPAPSTVRRTVPTGLDALDEKYRDICAAYDRGELSASAARNEVTALRYTDTHGHTWKIDTQRSGRRAAFVQHRETPAPKPVPIAEPEPQSLPVAEPVREEPPQAEHIPDVKSETEEFDDGARLLRLKKVAVLATTAAVSIVLLITFTGGDETATTSSTTPANTTATTAPVSPIPTIPEDNSVSTPLLASFASREAIPNDTEIEFGRSVQNRPLTFIRRGNPNGIRVLVVGTIHGDEPAGLALTDILKKMDVPENVDLWILPELNPDGIFLKTRQNANKVDLNRNFPVRWKPLGEVGFWQWAGTGPATEPEVIAMMKLGKVIQPQFNIWYHQDYFRISPGLGRDGDIRERYAMLVDLPLLKIAGGTYSGTATMWADTLNKNDTVSLLVEFGKGLREGEAQANADAIYTVVKEFFPS